MLQKRNEDRAEALTHRPVVCMVRGVLRRFELPLGPLEGGPKGSDFLLHELQFNFQQRDVMPHVVQLGLELRGRVSPSRGLALDDH
jgi:hypothetical protein